MGNLRIIEATSPEQQIKALSSIMLAMDGDGFDPVWDVQVVVPVNDKSPVSRKVINEHLQELLNTNPGQPNQPFRVDDKVVCGQNGFYPAIEIDESDEETQTNNRGDVRVANGEQARVLEVHPKHLVAQLDAPKRTIRIPRGKGDGDEGGTGCAWDLAYAITVHKAQGSEWPVVIVLIDEYPGAKRICDKHWLYTAISRAKKLCILLGKLDTAHRFCRTSNISRRQTFLAELIRHEQAARMLAEI